MAEKQLNFDAPLLSTRRMKKSAISVRRNMPKQLTDESKTSESLSVSVLVQDMGLDQVPDSPLESKHVEEEAEESEDDDVFSDALDTLSLKQSISGGGGVEAMKPSMPSEDPQFMLDRFLPAAKSLTLEQPPQYSWKRQPLPLMSEPMRQIRDIVPAENRATPTRYESSFTPSYYQDIDDEESEEDSDDDEVSEYLSKRGCGMMSPQICFKNSLGMLSSVNGLKEKPYSLRTPSHDQVKSSKVAQLKSRFQSVKKLALDYKQKLGSIAQSPVHPSVGKKFNFGSEQHESKSSASRPSSPYRQNGCMSPYRSVGNSSPLHAAGFPGTRKEAEVMRANRLNKHIRNISKSHESLYPKSTKQDCSTSSAMEKTLYVDSENSPRTSNENRSSNVKKLPETISEEPEMEGKKPKAVRELKAVETLSISSGVKMMKADELGKNNSGCDLSPLAPPPPKKPSESWLFSNLPSVSSKIPSPRYLFHPQKKNVEENSTSVTKWETIVKTSYTHRDHIRYSEELVAHSSCQSKT
ncbi:unnamed protein product [Arabidopsis thaliana]|jgi:hypothetical protein|uniref:Uncharacterized protein n=3 Tax=Arabidopsis thaliana TaxID=3702 RepID=A0A654EYN9_ARATH|nr:hypothetical protein (DUF688) [Arabidopsis thaliana]NP_001318347.1 hypothetical protein (DUF688) [Arabidopsis thaliana]NP_001325029.1 hypothetical protein (DUF688) [Arabidopsis thaliana]NP_001325030.1 hypothetical protein (DUF688) [Arabidopsis thaliana]NP_001325031.1 hypothetical protein (DUF688) [Arabidopsis thaliana]NP_180964.1 hypothetical protein (DUF688) [Arabidopsis thaliana]AAM14830.1 unknown protein [Arabidopsis thaliana]AEC08927.1 hypothetical protein (DUF688) [Arabidopsis thalia|eukprot:NP_001318346.1 hypothetical protein (DUF688) [Arabidopsis thaliana]